MKLVDLTNERFGRLVVQHRAVHTTDKKNTYWLCKCDCGNVIVASAPNLKSGKSKSCGCLWLEIMQKPSGIAGFNRLYDHYKRGAVDRDLNFLLTKDEFKVLTQLPCHYCGILPQQKTRGKEHSVYTYNGIDRKYSDIGYVLENCVSCCFFCNRAKNNMNYEEFIIYLQRITNYRKEESP